MVVATIAVLAAIAAPRYRSSLAIYRADAAASRVAADLTAARTRAVTLSAGQTVTFVVASGIYQVAGEGKLDRRSGAYSVNLTEEPYRSTLVSVNFSNQTQVTFNGFGLPTVGGAVTLSSGGVQKTVTVEASMGRVSIANGG